MNENEKLKEFWNKSMEGATPEKIEGKWIEEKSFNDLIHKYFKENDNILDYGCGSGWGLIELAYSFEKLNGVGIDQSKAMIDYANGCANLSNLTNIHFEVGDESTLKNYQDYFDGCLSINTIDVLEDEVIEKILVSLKQALKKDGYLLIGINPEFPHDFLTQMGYEFKEGYMFKNDILRGNEKTIEQWNLLLGKYFDVIENTTFCVEERDNQYPRRMFVLRNRK